MDDLREVVQPEMEQFEDRFDPEWIDAIQGDM